MAFVGDKLYNGYLRQNMAIIVSRVKPIEIMMHLPCLTAHDRESIEAKTETRGKYDGMMCLLDCLKRREHWPEQFINALEACEQTTIAAELRAEYNALMGINNSNPNVVEARVHPAPSDSRLSIPESGDNSQAAVAPAAEAPPASPEPAAQAPPPPEAPAQLQAPQSAEDHVTKAVSSPEPALKPPQPARIEVPPPPSTPPPSPEIPHSQVTAAPQPQTEMNSHQEPEENSESDIQDASGDSGVNPDQMSSTNIEVSVDCTTTPQPLHPDEHCETDILSGPDLLQTTVIAEEQPARSPSPTEINSDVTDGSDFPTMTPEKPPVQDTTPPVDIIATNVLQPEEISEPPTPQIVESIPQTETTASPSPEPAAAAGMEFPLNDDNSDCLSKPGQLVSVQPESNSSPTLPEPSPPVEPYSGSSSRLEISEAESDDATSAHIPACSAICSTIVDTVTALPIQENGIAPIHNEPEENHYESLCPSLETQVVLENVVQISEEPSILNLDGQTSAPHPQIINGEVAKEATSAPPSSTNTADDTVANLETPESYHPPEPAPADISAELETMQNLEEKTAPSTSFARSNNSKYILTAVGVGACALLMAWKLKN